MISSRRRLIRRAGYAVYMLPALGGSLRRVRPTLIDLSTRDRRWCQGNLQHLRVLLARKACISTSRQHFVTGIMAYVASPLWMLQLFVGIVARPAGELHQAGIFHERIHLFPTWPRFDSAKVA